MLKQFYFKQLSLTWACSLNIKTVLFQVIQVISTQFSSILPIDRTISGATTSGQSEPGIDGNEGVPHLHMVKWFQVLVCITNNSIKHPSFVYIHSTDQTILFLTIQLNMSFVCIQFKYSNSSIWPINRTLSGTTTLGQSQPGSWSNEEVLCIPQSSRTGAF